MNFKKELNKLIRQAKRVVVLKDEEKATMRAGVMNFVKQHPLKSGNVLVKQNNPLAAFLSWTDIVMKKPMLKYASLTAVFAVMIVSLTGVSFAARNKLPGDMLYPIKVNINEKVLGFLSFSNKSKAQYDVYLTQLRLEELEKVAVKETLSNKNITKAVYLLDKHIKNAQSHSESVKSKDKVKFSTDINSELEASLSAHSKILDTLADIKNNNNNNDINIVKNNNTDVKNNSTADNIKSIAFDVKNKNSEIVKKREDRESQLRKEPSNNTTKVLAENTLTISQEKIAYASEFIEEKKSKLSANSYANAQEAITTAKGYVVQGQTELQLGNSSQAFAMFQKATRTAEEAKINVKAEINLKVDLSPTIKINVDGNGTINPINDVGENGQNININNLNNLR